MALKIGVNGVGRIGRAVLRILLKRNDIEIAAVNDINPDIENIAYLIKYDSTYGRLPQSVTTDDGRIVIGNEKRIRVFHKENIADVPWNEEGVDLVVDASGVRKNLLSSRDLKKQGIRHCIATNSPPEEEIDKTIIMGVNHDEFDPSKHFLVSSSICDANAFVPVANLLDRRFGIEHGFLTTLHPWLSYQNLLDGPSISYATPGQIHDHYALGRSSIGSLIPKTTSAVSASCKVLKHLKGKFLSTSFRIPTMIVSAADLSVQLREKVEAADIRRVFEEEESKQPWKIFHNNKEALVSADFTGCEYSAVIDHRWIMVNEHNYLKMVLWYDNEWGYSARVVDLVAFIGQKLHGES
jgi:glyceraldehyde 3-phosphate dehydrogenase